MNTKKELDTNAIIRSQLKMIEERLNDKSYCEIWPQLVREKEVLIKKVNE